MPAKNITDAFTRNLTWTSAVKEFWREHKARNAKRKAAGKPEKEIQAPISITFIDKLERGLSLELLIGYGGSKTWRMVTYQAGRPLSQKLGSYPEMSLKEARTKAREFWADPKKFAAQAEIGTFKEVAENWIKRHVAANQLWSQSETERILARYIYPKWQSRKFLEIRRGEVNDLLDHIVDNHGAAQADQALAIIRGVMVFHQSRNEHYQSPVVRGMKRYKGQARTRILDDDEIRAVWAAADSHGQFGAIVKLALLTAQRREKIAQAKWSDIDLEKNVWTVPWLPRQKGVGGALKLPEVALAIIKKQQQIADNPYVFASGERKHFNSWSQRKDELDKTAKETLPNIPHWRMHDLRRTAKSLMGRVGVRPDISERVLGHAIAGVEGVYDRHHYFDEKAGALKQLAVMIESIINPASGDNVIQMPSVA